MNLEDWTCMLKKIGCQKTKNQIKDIIRQDCLGSMGMLYGSYVIDGEKVWKRLVENDPNCIEGIKRENIKDYIDIISWYERMQSRQAWAWNKSSYSRMHRKR